MLLNLFAVSSLRKGRDLTLNFECVLGNGAEVRAGLWFGESCWLGVRLIGVRANFGF